MVLSACKPHLMIAYDLPEFRKCTEDSKVSVAWPDT